MNHAPTRDCRPPSRRPGRRIRWVAALACAGLLVARVAPGGIAGASPAAARAYIDTLRTGAAVYLGFGLRGVVADPHVRSVLSALGEPDPAQWRLFHWSPGTGYVEAGAGFDTLSTGAGYWLVTRTPAVVPIAGSMVPMDTFVVELGRGGLGRPAWNQLANPFPFSVSTHDWFVRTRDEKDTLMTARGAVLAAPEVLGWNPARARYDTLETVPAGGVFWVLTADTVASSRWDAEQVDTAIPLEIALARDAWGTNLVVCGFVGGGPSSYPFRVRWYHAGDDWTFQAPRDIAAAAYGSTLYDCGVAPTDTDPCVAWVFDTDSPSVVFSDPGYGCSTPLTLGPGDHPRLAGAGEYQYLAYAAKDSAAASTYALTLIEKSAYSCMSCPSCRRELLHMPSALPLSVTVHPGGGPALVYSAGALHYVAMSPGGAVLDSATVPASVATWIEGDVRLDRWGRAHMLSRNPATGYLRWIMRAGGAWSFEDIELYGRAVSGTVSLAVDSLGEPAIAYYDSIRSSVRFAWRRRGAWRTETVREGAGAYRQRTAIELGHRGNWCVAYGLDDGLYFAQRWDGRLDLMMPWRTLTLDQDPGPRPRVSAAPHAPLVRMAASQGTRVSASVGLGTSAKLSPGARVWLPEGPEPPPNSDAIELFLTDWNAVGRASGVEVSPDVESIEAGAVVRLASWPGDVRLDCVVSDEGFGYVVEVSDAAGTPMGVVDPSHPLQVAVPTGERQLRLRVCNGTGLSASPAPDIGGVRVASNPARGAIALVFEVAAGDRADVEVFDVHGRRVTTLSGEAEVPGALTLTWRPDAIGARAPAGVYFARYMCGHRGGALKLVVTR